MSERAIDCEKDREIERETEKLKKQRQRERERERKIGEHCEKERKKTKA